MFYDGVFYLHIFSIFEQIPVSCCKYNVIIFCQCSCLLTYNLHFTNIIMLRSAARGVNAAKVLISF